MFGRRQFLWSTAVAFAAATAAACGGSESDDSPTEPTPPAPTGPSTLQITDITVGEGTEAVAAKTVFITYSLWRFDPNGGDLKGEALESGPYSWLLGSNQTIAGMNQGTLGMKVGGKRRLIIPPSLAYGAQGNGRIRPNEWLVFEIDLLAVA
jgi:FKBP-type peptidyl-prolyl cis-trans isomerase FkpA